MKLVTEVCWKDVKEYLPDVSDCVVIITKHNTVETVRYSKVHKTFNASDYDSKKDARKYSLTNDVKYWAYLNDFLLVGVSNEDKN